MPYQRGCEVETLATGETRIVLSGKGIKDLVRRAKQANYKCPLKWFLSYAICTACKLPMIEETRWGKGARLA